MGINMGVYIGLVCLLLACQGVLSSQNSFEFNSNDNTKQYNIIQINQQRRSATEEKKQYNAIQTNQQRRSATWGRRTIDIDLSTVTVKNATTVTANHKDVTALVTKELVYTCEVVDTTTPHFTHITKIDFVAIDEYGNETVMARVIPDRAAATYHQYTEEKATGVINNVPKFPAISTSATGNLSLIISYPTSEQIYTSPTTKRTVCRVDGNVDEDLAKEEAYTSVNVVEPTFQSLGGSFDIEPENIKPLLSEKLTVACHFNGIEAVKTVKKIEIKKDGVCVAECDAANHCVSTNTTYFPGANVTGWMDGASGNLIATVNYPKEVHSGSYECFIDLANQEERSLDATSDAVDVNATDPTLKDLVERVHELVLENNDLVSQIKTLKTDTGNNTDAISRQATHDTNQDSDIRNLQTDTGSNTKDISALETNDNTQDKDIQNNEDNIKGLKDRMDEKVFFTAVVSDQGNVQTLTDGQTLKFSTLIDGAGGGWDGPKGVWTCPVAGHYFFSFNVRTGNGRAFTHLLKNGIKKVGGGTTTNYINAGGQVILDLDVGDKIKLVSHGESNYEWIAYYTGVYISTFTGMLLK